MKLKKQNKNMTSVNKNPTTFYCKEEIKQGYEKKTYPKLVLNKFKINEKFYLYLYLLGT
jgi:hypothetical protein